MKTLRFLSGNTYYQIYFEYYSSPGNMFKNLNEKMNDKEMTSLAISFKEDAGTGLLTDKALEMGMVVRAVVSIVEKKDTDNFEEYIMNLTSEIITYVSSTFAVCSKKDKPDIEKGRKVALTKVLEKVAFEDSLENFSLMDKHSRENIWEKYFKVFPINQRQSHKAATEIVKLIKRLNNKDSVIKVCDKLHDKARDLSLDIIIDWSSIYED